MTSNSLLIIVLLSLPILKNQLSGQEIIGKIDIDFPGGNIIVVNNINKSTLYYDIYEDTINLRPDLRDTKSDWFYWFFRISGVSNKTLHFQFPGNYLTSFGPAISTDGGKNWKWLYNEVSNRYDFFSYKFEDQNDQVLFSSGIPYLQSNLDKFLITFKENPYISVQTLTTSEKGRNIEKIIISNFESEPQYKILITARAHACEAMTNYVLEGLIENIVLDNSFQMTWLRNNVEFFIVPFLDKDGVEEGDQGKNRIPHDHNRDYIREESIYNSIAELRKIIPDWGKDKLKIGIDLHCPFIYERGSGWNEIIHFVRGYTTKDRKLINLQSFRDILVNGQQGYLKVSANNSIRDEKLDPHSFKKYGKFTDWLGEYDYVSFATTLEFPYANNDGQQVSTKNARLFGKDLALAFFNYLYEY